MRVLLLLLTACSSVKSDEVATSGMHADLTVTAHGDGLSAALAALRVGDATSNTYVQLIAGDALTVAHPGETQTMSEVAIGDLFTYVASLSTDVADTEFTFALTREVGEPAPASVATMPGPFALLTPAADTVFSRATDPITVTWEGGTTDNVRVELHSECILTAVADAAGDPGTYTFEPGSYTVYDESADSSCEATLQVVRTRTGTLDPAFNSGTIYGAQARQVTVRLDP